ncbi:hypothetical protein [Cellulomonas cellasea]|uniref:Pilus assembly protein n=2 Tax=Cellulomonas cellasea TaxID=43670 RepID=A0A0A0B7X0_9CELL|nr:hypothetical protein [Cellulomonas cellasea]KGM01889.1 hypothetical protein Q760_16620 [Cellulomonas cellasea DSM 20118]MBB2922620.1 Flp pilus assembly pilin Flp [Cellulomonas cellasea]GEA86226.1 hypothetical protein CCE01nite_01750 [Cellulomonas cellasea]
MIETLNRKAVLARLAVTGYVLGAFERRDERGQGAVEYVGIILVVAAIIIALVALGPGLGAAIGAKITAAIASF